MLRDRIFATRAPRAALLVRLSVGAVFLSEGIQKLLFPASLASTKVPILLERGLWAMAHEARTDWAMLLGSLFLLAVGAGPLSLDARIRGPRS